MSPCPLLGVPSLLPVPPSPCAPTRDTPTPTPTPALSPAGVPPGLCTQQGHPVSQLCPLMAFPVGFAPTKVPTTPTLCPLLSPHPKSAPSGVLPGLCTHQGLTLSQLCPLPDPPNWGPLLPWLCPPLRSPLPWLGPQLGSPSLAWSPAGVPWALHPSRCPPSQHRPPLGPPTQSLSSPLFQLCPTCPHGQGSCCHPMSPLKLTMASGMAACGVAVPTCPRCPTGSPASTSRPSWS